MAESNVTRLSYPMLDGIDHEVSVGFPFDSRHCTVGRNSTHPSVRSSVHYFLVIFFSTPKCAEEESRACGWSLLRREFLREALQK